MLVPADVIIYSLRFFIVVIRTKKISSKMNCICCPNDNNLRTEGVCCQVQNELDLLHFLIVIFFVQNLFIAHA
jgi:hypothetical protein